MFADIPADRFAQCLFGTEAIEVIVHDLKGGSETIAELSESLVVVA